MMHVVQDQERTITAPGLYGKQGVVIIAKSVPGETAGAGKRIFP
jgi:hypothetical protein